MSQLVLTAGASVGRALAGTAASYAAGIADRLIFGAKKRKIEGPRLEGFQLQTSTEGAPILRVWGRARVAGEIIWAANFRETLSTTTESSGKGGRLGTKTTTTEYLYSMSFAVGLCEGEIDRIGRVWADGKPFDLSPLNVRLYRGTEDQLPDSLIEAVEGDAPAYRGLAYVVFEDLALKDFGNRLPQLSFEIEKSLRGADAQSLENALTAVCMIPGSGEFALGTTRVLRETREGAVASENVHNNEGGTDFSASLDALLAAAPNVSAVSLVVSWFGTDLRIGECELRPGVETASKTTTPYAWRVNGVEREDAHVVSLHQGKPAYGGTPADKCVVEAIAALKAKGLEVALHPFILMDIPEGNGLPDPYGGAEQAPYPWRGRMTVGANDKTAAASSDIAAFFGTAAPADFSISGGEVSYSGPAEQSFRRMILHYAKLASLAGGVDRFLIGSELRGLTSARSSASTFPAIAAMRALAADVRSILGAATKLCYAADWSEYFGHQPADGSGDVFFHLDPLWADSSIDFVGIDNYLPLADWREGFAHLDADAGHKGPRDRDYLMSQIEGGERFDYYYASEAARAAQERTPIADGAYGEPWVFRVKDFKNWWANAHHDRPGGVKSAAPTAWVPESKPILFMETGCPAVDKGANEPNVFVDPKSEESALPHFSSGARDDLVQRRMIEATLAWWRDPANNPVSSVYGGTMIDAERSFVYAYDARPFPFFPALASVWGDAANWTLGHWLNGRLGRAPLDLLITALAAESGVEVDASALEGVVAGYVQDRPNSAREAIEPLAELYQFDMVETAAGLRFQARDANADIALDLSDLAEREKGAIERNLAQSADLPAAVRVAFLDEGHDFRPAVAEARDPGADHLREIGIEVPVALAESEATARARALLADAAVARETAAFSLPPSLAGVEPGDVILLDGRRWRVSEIVDSTLRRIEAIRVHSSALEAAEIGQDGLSAAAGPQYGAPIWALMDLPVAGEESALAMAGPAAHLAAFADPWGGAALYREGASGPEFMAAARSRAVMGRLETALAPGDSGRFDHRSIRVRLSFGAFASKSEDEVLAGANALAVETAIGFEILQFRDAVLGADGVWTLSPLLRGQSGTEDRAALGAGAGARAVLLNAALAEARYPLSLRGQTLAFQAGPERDDPDTETFTSASTALTARGLMPLAPVHLRAAAEAGGVRLSWIRRSRIGGDSWEGEIPIAEGYERYRVKIFADAAAAAAGAPLRTIDAAPPFASLPGEAGAGSGSGGAGSGGAGGAGDPRPNLLYTNDLILEDFGPSGLASAPNALFEVAQLSDFVGEGVKAQKRFNA